MPPFDVLGSFQDPNNLDQGGAKLVNVRVVPRDPKERKDAKVRFMGSPGLDLVCQPVASPCIALCHALSTIWSAHANGNIYFGVETGAPTFAGSVVVNALQPIIRLCEDRTALVIASNRNTNNIAENGTGYTATKVANTGVVNAGFDSSIDFDPSAVAELDNITIWSGASNFYSNQNSKMYSSTPLAPATVPANNFATKEARADPVLDLAVSGQVVWPLGSRSMEQWYNPGGQIDFAFTPFPNSLIETGLAVRLTLAVLRGNIMLVGTDRRIWLLRGQSGQAISPPWIDLLLQQLTLAQLATLTAYAYGQGGSDFYVLTLPGSWSLEFAGSTGVWSYRQSPGRLDHAARCATEHDQGITYVGLDTGHVCTLDINSASEPAGTIPRTIISPWVGPEEMRTTYDAVDITSSMGPLAGNIQLDWSLDRGVTWHGVRQIALPSPGSLRTIARSMGTSRRRQFRVQYTGTQGPFTLDELYVQTTPGT